MTCKDHSNYVDKAKVNQEYPRRWKNLILLAPMPSAGGMADVFLAKQGAGLSLSRLVVVKRIRAGFRSEIVWLEMFKNEAQAMLSLKSPHIVQTFDAQFSDEEPYLVMEYVEGPSFKELFDQLQKSKSQIPLNMFLELLKQCAQALQVAHEFKDPQLGVLSPIIHRDISPQNMILSVEGYVKLIDFGIAKSNALPGMTQVGQVKGKLTYMSPEQFEDRPLDGRTDLFSLGIVFWELLTQQRLMSDTATSQEPTIAKIVKGNLKIKSPQDLTGVPPPIANLVMKLLNLNVEQRFASARQLIGEIENLQLTYKLEKNGESVKDFVAMHFSHSINTKKKFLQQLLQAANFNRETIGNVDSNQNPEITKLSSPNYAPRIQENFESGRCLRR